MRGALALEPAPRLRELIVLAPNRAIAVLQHAEGLHANLISVRDGLVARIDFHATRAEALAAAGEHPGAPGAPPA